MAPRLSRLLYERGLMTHRDGGQPGVGAGRGAGGLGTPSTTLVRRPSRTSKCAATLRATSGRPGGGSSGLALVKCLHSTARGGQGHKVALGALGERCVRIGTGRAWARAGPWADSPTGAGSLLVGSAAAGWREEVRMETGGPQGGHHPVRGGTKDLTGHQPGQRASSFHPLVPLTHWAPCALTDVGEVALFL